MTGEVHTVRKRGSRRSACALLVGAVVCIAIAAAPAGAVVRLASPPDNASVEIAPVFMWNAARGADHYELQLAADAHFASSVLASSSNSVKTANTAATLSKNLADGTYYWRVRAVTASGRAAAWSSARSFVKAWSTAPQLIDPNDLFQVIWPIAPLRLHWSSVPNAVAYSLVIATDPSLAAPIIGGTKSPVETQGTTVALPNALAPGRYYWTVTPKDSDGHSGRQSNIGSFTWYWPTQTTTALNDLNSDPRVLDPQFAWAAVPGAARYDVEVNPSHDWTPASKVCCSDPTIGTSLSPTSLLSNNTYYWRVRAIDAQGDIGQWNEGPSFQKDFDPVGPQVPTTIPNLRIRDDATDQLAGPYPISTDNPIIQWDPVPGASSYELQILNWTGSACNQLSPALDTIVYGLAWAPLAHSPGDIGPATWPGVHGGSLGTGTYCIRVLAQSDDKNGFISDWTWLNGAGNRSLTYAAQPAPGAPRNPFVAIGGDYLGALSPPATACVSPGSVPCTTRLPIFTWNRVPGAIGYYVVVARDQLFTQVVDIAYTAAPAYAVASSKQSGGSYTDETTHYYWAVIPYSGGPLTSEPQGNSPQAFDKQSIPPTPFGPSNGADVTTQPVFNWSAAEGARSYRLQVASDPNFGDLLDDVTTDSTAYTSATTYPVDTVLYWRVRAVDGRDVGLNWSSSSTFRRRLPAPTPGDANPTGGADIPVLGWLSVPGALSYGVHVDYPSGTTKDFTVYSTLFTPTEFYGNGVWHWKVRANFPNGSGTSSVAGAYTSSAPFTRLIPAPTGGLATRSAHRVLVTWDPDPHAYKYHLQTSTDSSFDSTIENVTTKATAYAPTLSSGGYRTGGRIYWRIASQDKGSNQGAFTSGTFVLPRGFRISTSGTAHKGRRGTLVVALTNASRKPIRGATVTVSGAGVRKATKHVDRHGRARFVVRPTRRGTITFRVHKRGYADGLGTIRVH
jgi:hypothetical protein